MFIVLKKKTLILAAVILAAVVLACGALGVTLSAQKTSALMKKKVVIDAGHGGSDRGVIGKNGTEEAVKNLEIAFRLKSVLEDGGFSVVMTRTSDAGADAAGGFKQEDFRRRKETIEKADPDMVVSIHCNKFPQSDRRGAQVFYNGLSKEGKIFADAVQHSLNGLNARYVAKTFSALKGEYYMLNCTENPSVIVECGFLSNPDDEQLLSDEKYLDELVFSIYGGIVAYLEV